MYFASRFCEKSGQKILQNIALDKNYGHYLQAILCLFCPDFPQDACSTDFFRLTGLKLVATFLETDSNVFERCDDSSGYIGGVFADAKDLFVDYASRYEDKKKITALLLKLSETDDYGVRADLITSVAECGIPEQESFMSDDREKLWLDIYQQQGESGKAADLLLQRFRHFHSLSALTALLETIGEDKRDEVVTKEIDFIFKQKELSTIDADFLLEIGKIDEAEAYLLKHANQLNGNFYGSLLSLVEALDAENRSLVVTLLYRSLLLSILDPKKIS